MFGKKKDCDDCEPKKTTEECSVCGHIISQHSAVYRELVSTSYFHNSTLVFCKEHAPAWHFRKDETVISSRSDGFPRAFGMSFKTVSTYYKTIPAQNIQVDENGKEIKVAKKNNKNKGR